MGLSHTLIPGVAQQTQALPGAAVAVCVHGRFRVLTEEPDITAPRHRGGTSMGGLGFSDIL